MMYADVWCMLYFMTNTNLLYYRATTAYDFAAQACLCAGIIMTLMGLFNLGNLIRFISYPVLTGFTNAAAMVIGLNQVAGAFGFPSGTVPQVM